MTGRRSCRSRSGGGSLGRTIALHHCSPLYTRFARRVGASFSKRQCGHSCGAFALLLPESLIFSYYMACRVEGCMRDFPQVDGHSCGAFACAFADAVARGVPADCMHAEAFAAPVQITRGPRRHCALLSAASIVIIHINETDARLSGRMPSYRPPRAQRPAWYSSASGYARPPGHAPCEAFGGFGTALPAKIGVFHS